MIEVIIKLLKAAYGGCLLRIAVRLLQNFTPRKENAYQR